MEARREGGGIIHHLPPGCPGVGRNTGKIGLNMPPRHNMPASWYREDCRDCPRLSRHLEQVREAHGDYFCKPVPPFGAPDAELLIVGLAPGKHGANRTGRPFTGDGAGELLYPTLHRFGLCSAEQSRGPSDGLELTGCRITNAVKCLPPANKPTSEEITNCKHYLAAELAAPGLRAVLAIGGIAHRAILRALGLVCAHYSFGHNRRHELPNGLMLIDSYHCSSYNVRTGRLTEAMFEQVFERIARLQIGSSP